MDYRIYDYINDKIIVECEYMSDLLVWLNNNFIDMDICVIQFYDGDIGWCDFVE